MTPLPPHTTLMLLHRLVDQALTPLLEPMSLEHATEGYITVERADIDGLVAAQADPQSALVGFGRRAQGSGLMVTEPALASSILSRIWRSDRNEGAPLTHVEGEILRQFIARIVDSWSRSWQAEGVQLLPQLTMAGSLSLLQPQLATGRWHVARTVVREPGNDEPIGVVLFCYPEALLPQLAEEARRTTWRARLARGLQEPERARLDERLATTMRHVAITAPVRVHQHMTLGMLNALERGDVVAFDENGAGEITFTLLGREVTGRLAQSVHGTLALALAGPEPATTGEAHDAYGAPHQQPHAADTFAGVTGGGPGDDDGPPDPTEWDLAS